ncbi:MAG: YraN family protein [Cytophagales bacterium]
MKPIKNLKTLGTQGERRAISYLQAHNFTIIATNQRVGRAEVDIIAKHESLLVFVEVKFRSSDAFGTPESFVTEAQAARYHEAATTYMEERGWSGPIRFDIIALQKRGSTTLLRHFEDAF